MSPPAAAIPYLFAIVLFAGGCAPIERPDVFVTNLTPLESTVLEQRFLVGLRFQNPNEFDLAVDGLRLKLDVNDARFLRAVSARSFVVPSFGEAETQFEASTTVLDLAIQMIQLREDIELSYRLHGAVHLSEPQRRKIRFDNEGTFGSIPSMRSPADDALIPEAP